MKNYPNDINPFAVIKAVEREYNIKPGDIVRHTTATHDAYARSIAVYICKEITKGSMNYIADHFDRSPSVIWYNYNKAVTRSYDLIEAERVLSLKNHCISL